MNQLNKHLTPHLGKINIFFTLLSLFVNISILHTVHEFITSTPDSITTIMNGLGQIIAATEIDFDFDSQFLLFKDNNMMDFREYDEKQILMDWLDNYDNSFGGGVIKQNVISVFNASTILLRISATILQKIKSGENGSDDMTLSFEQVELVISFIHRFFTENNLVLGRNCLRKKSKLTESISNVDLDNNNNQMVNGSTTPTTSSRVESHDVKVKSKYKSNKFKEESPVAEEMVCIQLLVFFNLNLIQKIIFFFVG